ncbi:hypothetical protein D3C84_838370 [compost metagenome]
MQGAQPILTSLHVLTEFRKAPFPFGRPDRLGADLHDIFHAFAWGVSSGIFAVDQRKSYTIIFLLETDKIRGLTGSVVVENDLKITLDEVLGGFPLNRVSTCNAVFPVGFFCDVDPCPVPSLEALFSDFKMPRVFRLDKHVAVQLTQVDEPYQRWV